MTRTRQRSLAGPLLGLWFAAFGAAAAGAEPFVVGPGDRIAITVHRRPDLSGEFRVLPGGALSLPFIGNLAVAGLPVEGIGEALTRRLREDAAILDPRVSVEIAELQPILVAGVIRRPGQFPFQLGMTVGHAVALAGGARRIEGEEIGARIEIARLREQLRQNQGALGIALVARTRLLAEAAGAADVDAPAEAARFLLPERLHQTLEAEREILRRRVEAHATLIAMLTTQREAYNDEIRALEEQDASKDQEAALLNQERAYVADLMRQGLTARDARVVQLARSAVQVEGERRQIRAYIARARQELARIEQTRGSAVTQRRLEITTGLKDAEDTIARLRVAVEEGRAGLAELRGVLPPEDSPLGPPAALAYTILRVRSSPPERIAARIDTPLLPGDLVEVTSDEPAPGRRLASEMPR
ncbi:polysaccharide biosynthesis/export family protein [Neoroseomonas soli]|uniref:Soluble ligand binding domain-containing protein n=1 Tax=Neoroseomonas soli TaxID=1081025 RepID=A0A9X9X4M3_9PROT|nr:polysaccharide biosynthesis/export family protein [Neoroseomonas soli]MBR0674352.1 hypothetical protein [Neoroseomonas soli]